MDQRKRTLQGSGWLDAAFQAQGTPGPFLGSTMVWDYNNGWNLTRPDGTVFVFGNDPTMLQEIRDRYGNRLVIIPAADSRHPAQVISWPSGRWVNFSYTNTHVISQISDNLGRIVKYGYTGSPDELTTVTDANQSTSQTPQSTTITWGSDPDCSNAVISSIKDPRQITFLTNTYGPGCRVTNQQVPSPNNRSFQFSYTTDPQGRVTQSQATDPNGNQHLFNFDPSGYVTSETYAVGTADTRSFTYEYASGTHLLNAVTDAFHSRRTQYTYFPNTSDLQSVTRLAGTAAAITTNYTYDPSFHQLKTITDPLSHTTTFGYEPNTGCLASITDGANRQTTFGCNGAGQVNSVTDALHHTTQLGYSHGDLVSTTDPLGRVTSRFTDGGGRVLSITDPLNHVTRYAYDNLNQTTGLTDAAGKQITFSYDEDGNLKQISDNRNATASTTNFVYNTMNLVQTRTDPISHNDSFTYDDNGNVLTWTDRKSQVTEYRYDALDRVKLAGFKRTGTPGNYSYESTVNYSYDGGGRLTTIADSSSGAGTITRGYDDLDRLTSETSVNSPTGIAYTYFADGTRKTMTVPGQQQVTYGYNNAGQFNSATQGSLSVVLRYYDDGSIKNVTLPTVPALVQTYNYDTAGQLTSLTYQRGTNAPDDLAYGYDAAGNRTSVSGSYARTNLPTATTKAATYDLANRLTKWNGSTVASDLNGNMTSQGGLTYSYNARNQLSGVTQGSTTLASFTYDGSGREIARTISGTTTKSLYDGWNVAQEQNGSGAATANLLGGLGLDQLFSRTLAGSGAQSYFLTDPLGSTVALADATGTAQTSYTYEPFGGTTASGASSTNPNQFTGRENDSTGTLSIYNMRARYYSPSLQRFLTEDPIGFAGGGPDLYSYVGNSPLDYADPLGLKGGGGYGRKDPAPVSTVLMPTAAPQSPPPRSASSFGNCAVAVIGAGLLGEAIEGLGPAGMAAAAAAGTAAVVFTSLFGLLMIGSVVYGVYSACSS